MSNQTPEIVAELRRIQEERTSPHHYPVRRVPDNFPFGNGKQIKKIVLLEMFDYKCFYCDRDLDFGTATKDHLIPRVAGGEHGTPNRVLSCKSCNKEKGDRMPTSEEKARSLLCHARYVVRQREKDRAIHARTIH